MALTRLQQVLLTGAVLMFSLAAQAQVTVDTGYVKFQLPGGWTARTSQDEHLAEARSPNQDALIYVLMSNDLPRTLPELGRVLEGEALKLIAPSFSATFDVIQHCGNTPDRMTFARWDAVGCGIALQAGGTRGVMNVYGIPLGGESYIVVEFSSVYTGSLQTLGAAHGMLAQTVHFWTENVDPKYQSGGSGDYSLPVSNIVGVWRGMSYFNVPGNAFSTHAEQGEVTLVFRQDATYSYSGTVNGWSSNHQGRYALTQIRDVPNKYEYNMQLVLTPTQGDDRQVHSFKARIGSIHSQLELSPDGGRVLHGGLTQQDFVVARAQ